MIAKDIMSAPAITISPDATVLEAARLMLEHRISGLPVTDASGALVGMITQGDLMRRTEIGAVKRPSWWLRLFTSDGAMAADYARAHGRFVREVMSRSIIAVEEAASVARVAELLDQLGVKRLPVVSGRRLTGIVSRHDLLKALIAAQTAPAPASAYSDAAIASAIRAAMADAAWIDQAQIVVVVAAGTARLEGRVSTTSQHLALRTLVENTPGVAAIDDRVSVGSSPA